MTMSEASTDAAQHAGGSSFYLAMRILPRQKREAKESARERLEHEAADHRGDAEQPEWIADQVQRQSPPLVLRGRGRACHMLGNHIERARERGSEGEQDAHHDG